MNKFKINILSYIRTVLLAIFLGMLCTCFIIYVAQKNVVEHASTAYNDKMLKQYIKNIVITQNQDLEYEHPDDYRIDIHLGYLHKVIQEYDKAEEYYKKAVQKAPMGIFKPLFELAMFYIEQKRYDDAYTEMEKFPHNNDSIVLRYLSRLYEKFGDVYYEDGLYYNSVQEYRNALLYWQKLNKSQKHVDRVNNKLYTSAIVLADIYMNNNMPDEAATFLDTALEAKPKDFNVQYKIALANVNINPEKSYKYFKKLFKHDAYKVDYKMYYALLEKMAYDYEESGDYVNAQLFKFRANDLLSNVSENILYPQDVTFELTKKSLYKKNGQCKILFQFNLKNVSPVPIKALKLTTVYKLGNKVIEEYNKDVLMKGCNVLPGDTLDEISVVPTKSRKYKKEDIPNINIEVYLYKSNPERRICVYNGYLFRTDSVDIKNSNPHAVDYSTYIKYFAGQIINMEDSMRTFKHNYRQTKLNMPKHIEKVQPEN